MNKEYASFASLPREAQKESQKKPVIWHFAEVDSSLDTAHRLAAQGKLEIWDSVFVDKQYQGRGQMRRNWISPPGNIYATLRLPFVSPFKGSEGAIAAATVFAKGLELLGYPVRLKWPNDLVIEIQTGCYKVAGLLLEERAGMLMAGIGINVACSPLPEQLREQAALPAGSLAACCALPQQPSAEELWYYLVNYLFSAYSYNCLFADQWQKEAERLLLWRNCLVRFDDGQSEHQGRLMGLLPDGSLLLHTGNQPMAFQSGSLRKGTTPND